MKSKYTILLLVATMLLLFVSNTQQPVAAQEIISGNLFENPGWESGYYNQDNIPQIAVPNGWRMHWLDNVTFEGTNGIVANRPETVVWYIKDAPEDERTKFFRDGSYTLKIFKSWAPLNAALSQDVTGLEVGRKYRIVAPIFVDIVESYDAGKVAPTNLDDGFVRFGVGAQGATWRDASQINYSPTWTAANVNPFYQTMPIFIWDFVATDANATIFIEMGSKYPYPNNAFFMDGVGLYALDEKGGVTNVPVNSGGGGSTSSAPAQTATPFPTPTPRADGSIVHVVSGSDTFWSIAIQYAPALDMTPEDALPYIMELNNSPAFIAAGQELLIKEPGAVSVTAEEDGTADETSSETAAEEGEEIVVEGSAEEVTPEPEATAVPAQETVSETASGEPTGVCVSAFSDLNGNGQLDEATEGLLSDAAITLFQAGTTVSTYITDGISEPHCFENLDVDSYEVRIFPPANYQATTADSWGVAVSDGVMVSVAFGVQEATEVASLEDGTTDQSTDELATDSAGEATEQADESGGLFSNVGGIVIGIAVFLLLLAGAGVMLLRRG